uniref:Integrase catalytic domain-containing protein n=1 Tax=Macrostomum lignano TaxID=282301 RepID=A0A1I8FC49_9PLAT
MPPNNVGEQADAIYLATAVRAATPVSISLTIIKAASDQDYTVQAALLHAIRGNQDCTAWATELSELDGLLLCRSQLYMPTALRYRCLQLAHQGVRKTLDRLQPKVWWPGMRASVEAHVAACISCQACTRRPLAENHAAQADRTTGGPWLELGLDFLGPVSGKSLLVCTDHFSRFPLVEVMPSTTASAVIKVLRRWFSIFRQPAKVTTDNGPPFASAEFSSFLANGATERCNQGLNKAIRAAVGDWTLALDEYLAAYRRTPHCATGVAPASLLFGRQINDVIPSLQNSQPHRRDKSGHRRPQPPDERGDKAARRPTLQGSRPRHPSERPCSEASAIPAEDRRLLRASATDYINCPSGQYLDVEKNDCSNCLAGTYSLGSGVRFDMWTAGLPDGFTSSADRLDTKDAGSCSRARWKTMGSYLSGQSDNNCQLSLTYTVNVVSSSGSVTFLYQYRSELELFAFEVQNGLCESVSSSEDSGSPLLDETDRNEIKRHTVPLKVGMNVLRWQIVPVADRIRPSSSSSASKSSSIIAIHSIEVSGIPYVYSCQSCHPGYSSAIGAPKCSKCQANTYSTSGQSCQACPAGQYSGPGAASCKPKPACAASDYALFYAQSPCTVANNYQVTRPSYNWIQPKVCDAGVSLPSNSGAGGNSNLPASCKGVYCNPGMRAAAANGEKDPLQCEACPEGQYSDGNSTVCQPCPAKT